MIYCKMFDELSARELYEIYRVRTAVFVVEQECPYQEVDAEDLSALHVFRADRPVDEGGEIVSYLRIFPKFDEGEGTYKIGRVLSMDRGTGEGGEILSAGLAACEEILHAKRIVLDAQTYAIGFYVREGFSVCGEEFLEDGIPHTPMGKDV